MAKVAIIGTGFIGRAWAIVFARAGHGVALWDRADGAPEAAREYIETVLPGLEEYGLLGQSQPEEMMSRIRLATGFADALSGVEYVQENSPENLEVKKALFAELDAAAPPDAILASSTSSLLPSAFTADLKGRARCMVVHPINPPYLIPAAELVPSPWTTSETIKRARAFLIAAGQKPIVMNKELAGFVMNRMQGALLEEAFRLVTEGFASAEDIDIGLREGLALRWSFMGPFETIDLNAPAGIRDYVQRYQFIYEGLAPSQWRRVDWSGPGLDGIEADLRARLPAVDLEKRQVWRDKRLMALAAHKKRAARDIGE